jgi:lantibiotic modifying enzyme
MRTPERYRGVADAAWRWVLAQVRWTDGPWIPETTADAEEPSPYRYGMHSGVGGLAYVLAEIRLAREWTVEEKALADAIAEQLNDRIPTETDYLFFDGLVSDIGALTALEADGVQDAVRRLLTLATPNGWPQTALGPPKFLPDARVNDLVLGTAGVLLGAVWAHRVGVADGRQLGELAGGVLLDAMETVPTGADWPYVAQRFRTDPVVVMPNFSHGVAGVATALALAGTELDRPDLTAAAVLGAEHLVTLGATDGESFVVPRRIPPNEDSDEDEVTYNWCHGPAGTSLLFLALHHAGVESVAGVAPLTWHRRCLHSVRTSGLPARLHPGFWDNDGRCCGTAGVGDIFLDSWQRGGDDDDREFALRLADTLLDHAVLDGSHAYWRFTEHRAEEPLLPPGVGWLQGAAGIAAFLFRASRVAHDGPDATTVPRMDSWWAVP